MNAPANHWLISNWTSRALAVLLFFCLQGRLNLAAEVTKEYQLKAVLLWRLAQFVDWPAESLGAPDRPIVIGILGENPFGASVDIAARGETAHGRRITVVNFRDAAAISDCHILYVAQSESGRVREIMSSVSKKSILTVSDLDGFARRDGGMVRFQVEQKKVKVLINLQSARAAGLNIDARLLRIAEVVNE